MYHLRAYGATGALAGVGAELERRGLASHLALAPGLRGGHSVLTGDVSPDVADEVLDFAHEHGLAPENVALGQVEEIGRPPSAPAGPGLIWADALGQASRQARPVGRYLALMAIAGVIAAFGVIEVNQIADRGRDGRQPRHLSDCGRVCRGRRPPCDPRRPGARDAAGGIGFDMSRRDRHRSAC